MLDDKPWIDVVTYKGGEGASLRISVQLPKDRVMSDEIRQPIDHASYDLFRGLQTALWNTTEKEVAAAKEQKEKLVALFDGPIFVEEIANGYDSQSIRKWPRPCENSS